MKLSTEVFGDVVVVHSPEDMGETRTNEIEHYLCSLEKANVIVDLNGTETIDSDGLESLLNAQETLRQMSGELKVATNNFVNRKLLEITRIDQRIEVFDSLIDAVRSFG